MSFVLNVLFSISLLCMAIVCPMYFIELWNFRRILENQHPGLLRANETEGAPSSFNLSGAYGVLKGVGKGKVAEASLSAEALRSCKHASKLLHLGAFLFMATLLLGLTQAIVGKQA